MKFKQQDVDGNPSYFVKYYAEVLRELLDIVYSTFVLCCPFPDIFKLERVVPIHKNGNPNDISSYRPVTVLTSMSKIFTQIIYNRIYYNVEGIIISEQHGFGRKN